MSAARKRILAIEDTPEDAVLLREALGAAGYDVVLMADAERGLVEARRELPALIIMDIRLPGIDGWEATRRLKSDPLTAPVPVLVLTATRVRGAKVHASRCDAALQKPVEPALLLAEVSRLILR